MNTETVLKLLGNPYPAIPRVDERVRRTIESGSSKALTRAWPLIGIDHGQAATVIGISRRTLERRLAGRHFPLPEADRAFRIVHAFALATDVLGSAEKAKGWFHQRLPALGDRTPLACLTTEVGAARVRELLEQVEHGIYH